MKIRISTILGVAAAAVAVIGTIVTAKVTVDALKNEAQVSVTAEDDAEVAQATVKNLTKIAGTAACFTASTLTIGGLALIVKGNERFNEGLTAGQFKGVKQFFDFVMNPDFVPDGVFGEVLDKAAKKFGMTVSEYREGIILDMISATKESK